MIIERCSFSTVQATARFAPPDGSLPPPYVESATPIDPRPPRLGRERLEVTSARIHLSSAGRGAAEVRGHATLTNETSATATLVGLDCPDFARVEMRDAAPDGAGHATHVRRSLTVLPGDSVTFGAGERQLTLIGPRRAFAAGQLVGITMIFASGRRRVVPFRIAATTRPRAER